MATSNEKDIKRRKLTLGDCITYIIALLFFLFVCLMLSQKWIG